MSDTPQYLLIRGVNWLGDAIMTLPAVTRLREALPKTRFTLLSHEKLAGLWAHTAHFDQVLTFAKENRLLSSANASSLRISMQCSFCPIHSAPPLKLGAGIPRRIGYSGNWRSPLLTHAIAPRPRPSPCRNGCH